MYVDRLHKYNEIKDVAQSVIGRIGKYIVVIIFMMGVVISITCPCIKDEFRHINFHERGTFPTESRVPINIRKS